MFLEVATPEIAAMSPWKWVKKALKSPENYTFSLTKNVPFIPESPENGWIKRSGHPVSFFKFIDSIWPQIYYFEDFQAKTFIFVYYLVVW